MTVGLGQIPGRGDMSFTWPWASTKPPSSARLWRHHHRSRAASYLQEHADARVLLDMSAAGGLTGIAKPWLLENVAWTETLIKRAVLWPVRANGQGLAKVG